MNKIYTLTFHRANQQYVGRTLNQPIGAAVNQLKKVQLKRNLYTVFIAILMISSIELQIAITSNISVG
jgi:hypothetical protein